MKNQLERAADIIKRGGIVIFPTDTVFGLGCLASNYKAMRKIYEIKQTPNSQPLPRLVAKLKQVAQEAEINKEANKLIKKHWPGALTIILTSKKTKNKIGYRMPNSNLTLELIKLVGSPIIGTSANFHGGKPPTNFKEIDPKLSVLADFSVKGECELKSESTVVDASSGKIVIIREGAIKL